MKKLLTLFILAINLFANSLDLDGIVQSQNEKIISSKMIGYITKIYVNEGDNVKKGQLLYEIDPTDIIHNSDILKSQVQNLELNLKRYKDLLNQDLVSKFEYEQLELNLITAKAKLSELNANLNYLKVKATNNALVIKKSIKEGEMAMPGMPHLILTDLDDLIIKSNIAESNLKNIKINQEVNIEIPSQEFKAKGKIVAIFPNIASNTHSFSIKIFFDKKDFQIYPNMYAKISINLDK
ncbi:efflux RND transporter periplasmic adaptor subunit [Arcobacter lanthieri]|uniref:efflux RND transporter periplasmic adaptor subunit n=1 Tax=Aliarcobacter lanthieri TaxID=1355374 RepID=UPI001924592F|nr:efflux RND transporter periplasmic adaptor subunit [Aliarcobacter lanthieri]MBL3519087.1 efflux RND transporter periplasmic adaptor subunit [Aliarcobacter lanthieri]